MKFEFAVIPAKAGIQRPSCNCDWPPAFAGVTTSYIFWPDQYDSGGKPPHSRGLRCLGPMTFFATPAYRTTSVPAYSSAIGISTPTDSKLTTSPGS